MLVMKYQHVASEDKSKHNSPELLLSLSPGSCSALVHHTLLDVQTVQQRHRLLLHSETIYRSKITHANEQVDSSDSHPGT